MTYIIPALTLLGAIALTPSTGRAQSVDDYLQHGYTIALATTLPGLFAGCTRDDTLTFADGSTFTCAQTVHRKAFNPRVLFLRENADRPSVLLIGGYAYQGFVHYFGKNKLTSPFVMVIDALDDQQTTPGAPDEAASITNGRIDPVAAIQSINDLQKDDPTLLNTAQSQDVTRSPMDETEDAKEEKAEEKQTLKDR
jgi:hypothetical protein